MLSTHDTTVTKLHATEPVTDDGWKHIVFTWDMASGLSLYLNGEEVASNRGEDAWWIAQFPSIFHIPSDKFTVDELYIFDRPITSQEVHDLYTSNRPPKTGESNAAELPGAEERLAEKSGISTALDLPVAKPSNGKKTLVFEEVWIDDIGDGYIPGRWLNDGAYWIAWPHPYAYWTTIIGDFDFHAEKIDIRIPKDKTVNYITLEGNLQAVKIHELFDEQGIETKTLLEVPPKHAFFYGSLITPVSGKHLRIPLVKEWGTPNYYKGDVHLPLTGDTRIQEIGFYNVTEAKQRSGETLYLSAEAPKLDSERWGFALRTVANKRDSMLAEASEKKPHGKGRYIDTGAFRRLNILSRPWTDKGGVASLCIDLFVRTRDPEDVLLVRLRDAAIPSRIWSHAEVKLQGFDADEPGLLSLTFNMTDMVLTEGDRLWLDVCSASGMEVLVGDEKKQSTLIVENIPVEKAVVEYSPKEIYTARAAFCVHSESPLWLANIHPDYRKPTVWCGNFDTVYPIQAVLRADPDYKEAQILWNFASGKYYYPNLRDLKTGTYYNSETYPESRLIDIDVPADVPQWAAYMRAYMKLRKKMGEYWPDRQNPDGQYGGGWNDDATHLLQSMMDLSLDGNQKLLTAVKRWRNTFEKTRIYHNGHQILYPMDEHHTKDTAFGVKPHVCCLNLGRVHEMEKAMEIAWHYKRSDRTPMHYTKEMPNFVFGYEAVRWYWGYERPKDIYIGPDEDKLVHDLRYWCSANDETALYWLKSYREFGSVNLIGSHEFHKIFHGGIPTSSMTLAVSWPQGGGSDVARWVEYADDTTLRARIYSFDENKRTLTARFYRLENGKYSVVCAPDMNNDGKPDGNPAGEIMNLRRFSDVELTLPPKTPLALEIKQIESYGDPGPLPDLAVDPEDIRVSNNFITVTVHNIGNAPVDNVKVTLLVEGQPYETQVASHIDAPTDFVPKFYTLYFMDFRSSGEVVGAVVDPDNAIEEIYEANNRSVAADYRGDNYFDWTDIPYVP